jgi:hypothetical protein
MTALVDIGFDVRCAVPAAFSVDPDIWRRPVDWAIDGTTFDRTLRFCNFWTAYRDAIALTHSETVVIKVAVEDAYAAAIGDFKWIAASAEMETRLLGYDIADLWLTSAIHNCGLNFDVHLNAFGLIGEQELARDLAAQVDIPLHAPFYVFGLHECLPLGKHKSFSSSLWPALSEVKRRWFR